MIEFHWAISPQMKINTNEITAMRIINKITFKIPTLDMSPIASPIAKALPKSSLLANLHCAIIKANENINDNIAPMTVTTQCWNITPKIAVMMIGIIM